MVSTTVYIKPLLFIEASEHNWFTCWLFGRWCCSWLSGRCCRIYKINVSVKFVLDLIISKKNFWNFGRSKSENATVNHHLHYFIIECFTNWNCINFNCLLAKADYMLLFWLNFESKMYLRCYQLIIKVHFTFGSSCRRFGCGSWNIWKSLLLKINQILQIISTSRCFSCALRCCFGGALRCWFGSCWIS